jgi:Protein of unknown function (DUF1573)
MKRKDLTKSEQKELKKKKRMEQKETARLAKEKIEKRDRYVKYGVVAIILVAGFYLLNRDSGPSGGPKIAINPTEYDFGEVSVRGPVVSTTMSLKNEGGSDLVINNMDTSCPCTSVTLTKGGIEGPAFLMSSHGLNPVGWSETLKPGESAILNVYYNAATHPDSRGSTTMVVWVYSNDPNAPEKMIKIDTNQVD